MGVSGVDRSKVSTTVEVDEPDWNWGTVGVPEDPGDEELMRLGRPTDWTSSRCDDLSERWPGDRACGKRHFVPVGWSVFDSPERVDQLVRDQSITGHVSRSFCEGDGLGVLGWSLGLWSGGTCWHCRVSD